MLFSWTVHSPPISNLISVFFTDQLSSVPNVISRRAKQKKVLIRNQNCFSKSLAQVCIEWRWSWLFHSWAVHVRSFKIIWEKLWRSAPQWCLFLSCARMYFSPCLLFIFIHLAVSIKLMISNRWIQIQYFIFFSPLSFIILLSFSPIANLISILALLKEWKYYCIHFLDNSSNRQHLNDYKLKTCFCWTSGDSHSSYLHLSPCDNILVRSEIDFSFPRTR